MSGARATERQLRKLQKLRHMYDIQQMILSNPLLKNLKPRDQKKIQKLLYKAEMIEVFMRDRDIVRINESFESIANSISDALDRAMNEFTDDEDDDFK